MLIFYVYTFSVVYVLFAYDLVYIVYYLYDYIVVADFTDVDAFVYSYGVNSFSCSSSAVYFSTIDDFSVIDAHADFYTVDYFASSVYVASFNDVASYLYFYC